MKCIEIVGAILVIAHDAWGIAGIVGDHQDRPYICGDRCFRRQDAALL